MSFTDQLINVALLGTGGRELTVTGFPEELQDSLHDIQAKAEDAEAAFYQVAALSFAFERAGLETRTLKEPAGSQEAPEEEQPYFSREVGELLTALHLNCHAYLLLYAYRKAVAHHKLLPPACLPVLLRRACERTNPKRKEERYWLSRLAGHRGRWLLPAMELPEWGESNDETWETASHEERKRMLCRLREEHPEQGLALLQTELKNEPAVNREELIECLGIGLNKSDEPFLQEIVAKDRSGYVKEVARRLLGGLADSELVKTYQDLLRGKLHYSFLLGWSYEKMEYTPEMRKLGFEEVSFNKKETDDRFLLRQLAERVPLSFWSEFYDCTPENAAAKLAKNPPFQKWFDLSKPILNFKDSAWAYHTLKENASEARLLELAGLLSPSQREEIVFPTSKGGRIPDNWFNEDGTAWGMKFSTYVLQRILHTSHYLPKEAAEQLALYFPPEMKNRIEHSLASLTEQEGETPMRFCRQILEYMDIKQKIDTLLNNEL